MFLCAILFSGCATSAPAGFRNMAWGTDINSFSDLVYDSTDPSHGGIKFYTKKSEDLQIGSATADKIVYGFWRDKLFSVGIFVVGNINWEALKSAAFEKFGSQPDPYLDSFYWSSHKTIITLDHTKNDNGVGWLKSREMVKQQEAYEKRKAKEGAAKGL
jgi:hypothetical protein